MRYNIPQMKRNLIVLGEFVLHDGMEFRELAAWYVNCFYAGTHFLTPKNIKPWKQ